MMLPFVVLSKMRASNLSTRMGAVRACDCASVSGRRSQIVRSSGVVKTLKTGAQRASANIAISRNEANLKMGRCDGNKRHSAPALYMTEQFTRLPDQVPIQSPSRFSFARVEPMLQCILISTWRAGSRRATMHTTSLFTADSGRATGPPRTGSWRRSASWTTLVQCYA